MNRFVLAAGLSGLLLVPSAASGEVIEEIVAWVNGEIITASQYKEQEQTMVADAYRRYSGDELDQEIARQREGLLLQLIHRKILVDYAQRLYDMETMGEVFLKGVREQQNIATEEELERLLEQEGATLEEFKARLVEMFAPEEVLRFEVTSRIAVSDAEVEAFYEANTEKLEMPAEVTLRELVLRADDEAKKRSRRAEAEAIRQRLVDGEDFAELARQVSEAGTKEEGGLLGPLKIGELSELLRAPALGLPVGEVSEIIDAPYGFHIVRVESRKDAQVQPLDEIRDQVREYLRARKEATEIAAFLDKARDESEWCVKPKFQALLSIPARTTCRAE